MPSERTRAVKKTKRLLLAILSTPVSHWDKKAIRKEIANCLRHYPSDLYFSPDLFEESFELSRPENIEMDKKETEFYQELITKKPKSKKTVK